ncbi:MAG: hypothetical protein MJ241_03220 [Bacilli bacterium]|nr:hypothetical protein [Bacilli bacterium]
MKIKAKSLTYIIASALLVASLVAVIISNSVEGYAMSGFALTLTPLIIGIVLSIFAAVYPKILKENEFVKIILGLTIICLICWSFGNIILQRSELVAAQFTYDKVNKIGWQALIPSLISIGLSVLSTISVIIGSFLKD